MPLRVHKFLALMLALSLLAVAASAQAALQVGDLLPNFTLSRVVNAPVTTFEPAAAQGKVLVLEFWSTTCSPCIPALLHLHDLQQQHLNDLLVVGISPDSEARLQKFLTKRPVSLLLASAPEATQAINRLFPHRLIPHTVVVDKQRRIVAITTPEQVTEQVLRDVAAGQPIHLKPKQDVLMDDPMSFFVVDSTTRYGVSVRPFIQGLPGMLRAWRLGPFAGRRLTAINVDPVSLFQIAYGVSYCRVQNQLPDSLRQYDDLSRLCFDLIVPPGREVDLHTIMRDELRRYAPVQAEWVPTTQPTYVLRRTKHSPALPVSTKPTTTSFSGGTFEMQGGKLALLSDYLENELGKPVVDETDLGGRYDVALTLEQENLKPSLGAALGRLGLELVEAPRTIKVLRLTSAPASKSLGY